MNGAFRYIVLDAGYAASWRAMRLRGAQAFPMGFLMTEAEIAQETQEDCARVLCFGALRGVLSGDRLVGFCGFRPGRLERLKHGAELGPFFVDAPMQGTGAAQALMQGAVDEARGLGLAHITLHVDAENGRAIAFYERCGFRFVAEIPDHVRDAGRVCVDRIYRLAL